MLSFIIGSVTWDKHRTDSLMEKPILRLWENHLTVE